MALRFAPHVDVRPLDGPGLIAFGERGADLYPGPGFARLVKLIDGSRSEQDLLEACDPSARDGALSALAQLKRDGVVVEQRDVAAPEASAAWWSSQRVAPEAVSERLSATSVSVRALDGIDVEPTAMALTESGVRVVADSPLMLVLVEDYLSEELADVNRRALEAGQDWMLAQPHGAQALVGPVFSPDRGPCWECLAERLRIRSSVRRRLGIPGAGPRVDGLAAARGVGPALVATELLRFVAGVRPELDSTVLSLDTRNWQLSSHRVVWRPQCPACGEAGASLNRGAAPIRLTRARPGGSDVELRSISPRTTLMRFEHHVSPMTGLVDALVRHRGPSDLHVYGAESGHVRVHGDRRGWERLTGMGASGKGTTDESARASALCEALERHSGIFQGDEPRRRATAAGLDGAAVLPNEYMCFSDQQFAERGRLNGPSSSFRTFVPERFDPEEEIDWSPVWSLTHEEQRWLPTGLAYYAAGVAGQRYCVAESNGNAAGNTVEEAILHGLLELAERDHVALWWYNRTSLPGVDLDSIDDPWLARLRAHLAREDRQFWALDLTADLGIPVAACLTTAGDGVMGMGLGAHLDLRSAVIRAATELTQLGLGGTSGGLGEKNAGLRLADHDFARADPDVPARRCTDAFSGDVLDALERCREQIERKGLDVLVLDQTRPDVGLPVVKTIVPGLRHFWPRFGAGRLYDVPVALGRLSQPRPEHELEPTPPTS